MNMYININPLKWLRANCLFTNKTTKKLAVNRKNDSIHSKQADILINVRFFINHSL